MNNSNDISLGYWENDIYTNKSAKVKFTLPEGWKILSNSNKFQCFVVTSYDNTQAITLTAEIVSEENKNISARQFAMLIMEDIKKSNPEGKYELYTKNINNKDFWVASYYDKNSNITRLNMTNIENSVRKSISCAYYNDKETEIEKTLSNFQFLN